MKRIFITGIAGFIGFHLARRLKTLGYDVSGCDNFNDYYDPALKRKRASLLRDIPIHDQDIRTITSFDADVVIHLAAQAGVRYSLKNPQKYVDANLDGFVKILEARPKKLIFASSSSVYGLNTKVPFSETDPTDRPASLYGATKKANELLAHSYHHLYKIPMIGLRFFTVYGPYGRPDMAYYSFSEAITEDRPIHVFNHGQMERDFTYIDDIVTGIVNAIDYDTDFEIFNLGNNRPEKLETLITLLEDGLGKKAIKKYEEMQLGDVIRTYADITKAQKVLNFEPKTSLREGLGHFLDWYKSSSSRFANC